MKSTFDEDFPAILEKKMNKKMKKKKEKDEMNRAAEVMSSRTYKIMVSALEDLVSSKKGLLVAFRLWKVNVGMESSTPEVSTKESDEEEPKKRTIDTNVPIATDDADTIYTRCNIPVPKIDYFACFYHRYSESCNPLRQLILKLRKRQLKHISRAILFPCMTRGITLICHLYSKGCNSSCNDDPYFIGIRTGTLIGWLQSRNTISIVMLRRTRRSCLRMALHSSL